MVVVVAGLVVVSVCVCVSKWRGMIFSYLLCLLAFGGSFFFLERVLCVCDLGSRCLLAAIIT